MLLFNVFALNIIGLILSQLGITEQMKHCKRKLSELVYIQFPGVAATQDNIFLWQVRNWFLNCLDKTTEKQNFLWFLFIIWFARVLQSLGYIRS